VNPHILNKDTGEDNNISQAPPLLPTFSIDIYSENAE
jgi:hypothetical protein